MIQFGISLYIFVACRFCDDRANKQNIAVFCESFICIVYLAIVDKYTTSCYRSICCWIFFCIIQSHAIDATYGSPLASLLYIALPSKNPIEVDWLDLIRIYSPLIGTGYTLQIHMHDFELPLSSFDFDYDRLCPFCVPILTSFFLFIAYQTTFNLDIIAII